MNESVTLQGSSIPPSEKKRSKAAEITWRQQVVLEVDLEGSIKGAHQWMPNIQGHFGSVRWVTQLNNEQGPGLWSTANPSSTTGSVKRHSSQTDKKRPEILSRRQFFRLQVCCGWRYYLSDPRKKIMKKLVLSVNSLLIEFKSGRYKPTFVCINHRPEHGGMCAILVEKIDYRSVIFKIK